MASSGNNVNDGVGNENMEVNTGSFGIAAAGGQRNPLICSLCHDYYIDPCLLSCFHTFCAKCLRGPHIDGKLSCPICG